LEEKLEKLEVLEDKLEILEEKLEVLEEKPVKKIIKKRLTKK